MYICGSIATAHSTIAVKVHEEAAEALGLLLLHWVQGVDGELEAAGGPLLKEEYHGRDYDRNDGQRRGEVVVRAVFPRYSL